MLRKTIAVTGVVIASLGFVSVWTSAGAVVGSGQDDTGKDLQARLPDGFPIPDGAVNVQNPDKLKLKVEGKVPGYTAEKLLAFFRQELPKKGFTIVAQNPPRVVSYEVPVTLIVKTPQGRTQGIQIQTKSSGDVVFTVS